jgi:hypothetical protein
MKNIFDAKRFFLMLTREFTLNTKNLLIIALSMIFVSMVITYFGAASYSINRAPNPALTVKVYMVYPFIVLVYCAIVTTYSFLELNTSDKKIDLIMLPASVTEKYLTKFIYTTFGFVLLATLALSINTLFVNLLNADLPYEYYTQNHYYTHSQLPFVKINYWTYLHYYLVIHSILFFGGIYFVKMELPKTILAIVGIMIGISLLSLLLNAFGVVGEFSFGYNTNFRRFLGGYMPQKMQWSSQSYYSVRMFIDKIFDVLKFILMYIFPIFFWILGFLRLREIEVIDGV